MEDSSHGAREGDALTSKSPCRKPGIELEFLNRLVEDLKTHQAYLEGQNEELRIAHENLIEAKKQYADLFDFAPVGYVTVDERGIILEANATIAAAVGADRASLVGRSCVRLFHPEDRDDVCLLLRELANGRQVTCDVRLQPSGVPAPVPHVRLRGRPAVTGVAPCRIAVSDITEQHQREAEREATRDLLQRAIDGMDEPILVVGLDHEVRLVNRVAREQRVGERIRPCRCFHLLHGWEHACPAYGQKCPLEEIARLPRPVRLLHEFVAEDGSDRTMEIFASPFFGPDGALEGIIERARDITDQLRIEKELERAHKIESLGVLAGGVAHDFNNLLTAIQGTTDFVWQTAIAQGRPPTQKDLETVRQIFARASALTKQLLTFSHGGAPVSRACSLAELVHDASNLAAAGSTVRCRLSIPQDMPPVHVDPAQFGQVIHNIVLNAVQAMPDGGTIDISAEQLTMKPGDDPSLEPGTYARLDIRDNGPGMPPDVLRKVFEPYFTTKSMGNGLGLSIVHSIVKRHGGSVQVRSTQGQGTAFVIRIPLSRDQVRKEKPSYPPTALEGRILVMDDVADVRWLLEKSLERLGCIVDVAEHGEQALEFFEHARAQGRPYQAVILDLTVVDGMGGLEAMRRIRAIDPEVRGVVSSGYSNDPVLANPEQYGFDARLEKPFTSDIVAEVLADVLAQVRVPGRGADANGRTIPVDAPRGKELATVYQQLQTRKGPMGLD